MKLLLFDLDGTILDTVPDIMACCNDVLAEFSLPQITEEETKRFVGNGAKKLVERMLKGKLELFDRVYAHYREVFPLYQSNTRYFEDEITILDELKGLGYTFAVVTNKPASTAKNVMQKFFPDWLYFAQSELYPLKPDPSSTIHAMNVLGFSPQDTIFIGDGETDVQTAINAGIVGISVLWGYRSQSDLQNAGAKYVARNFKELKELILRLS